MKKLIFRIIIILICLITITGCDYDFYSFWLGKLGRTDNFEVHSDITSDTYDILVFVPDGYEPGELYPSVYLLDAYDDILQVCRYAIDSASSAGIKAPVVIGIEYTGEERRMRDFTPLEDTSIGEETGGAQNYSGFLSEELIPFIEDSYSLDPGKRNLLGHSVGGLFCIYNLAANADRPVFSGFVAASPSLFYMNEAMLAFSESALEDADELEIKIYTSVGEYEDEGMHDPLNRYISLLSKLGIRGLQYTSEVIENRGHGGSARPSYERGLSFLLSR